MESNSKAIELSSQNRCVICEKQFSRLTRGLCSVHHTIWLEARSQLNEIDAEELDAKLIREGKLLPDGRKKSDSFANELAAFVAMKVAERKQAYDDSNHADPEDGGRIPATITVIRDRNARKKATKQPETPTKPIKKTKKKSG